ncbi:MAG: FtsX-like permease family protein [Planctomycetota bacterium]|nr:FtsX-like permease family protein [Planctomycetota bacterium]
MALLTIAIALACALTATLSSAMSTLQENIAHRLDRLVGSAQARLVHSAGEDIPLELEPLVRALPGVVATNGIIYGSLLLTPVVANDAVVAARVTVQAVGWQLDAVDDAKRFDLLEGTIPHADGEVLLDPMAAELLNVHTGATLIVERFGDPMTLTVCGVYDRPTLGALQRPIARMSRTTLAQATDLSNGFTQILITLGEGTSVDEWISQHRNAIDAVYQFEAAEAALSGMDRPRRAMALALSLFSMIGFLCCAFIVATGLTSAIGEQTRELAILRSIGASRSQIFAGQLMVGAIVGVVGAAVGVPIGLALSWLVANHFESWLPLGWSAPWWSPALAATGGIVAGVLGAAYPALRASLVSPLEAMRVRASPPTRRGIMGFTIAALACFAIQLALLTLPDGQPRFWGYILCGLPLLHIGWFLGSVPLLIALTPLLGRALERALSLPRGLLIGSLFASPYRFGLTAGAMMVGVSVLVGTQSNGRAILSNFTERVRFADAFVFKTTGLSSAEQARIRAIGPMENSVSVGYLPLRVQGYSRADGTKGNQILGLDGISPPNVVAIGFQPRPFFELTHIDWLRGTPEDAIPALESGEGILVASEFLFSRGLDVGDSVELGPDGRSKSYRIVGVVAAAGLDVATQFFGIRSIYAEHALSCVFLDFEEVARTFGSREAYIMQVGLPDHLSTADERVLGEQIQATAPGALFTSGRQLRGYILDIGETIVGLFTSIGIGGLLLATLGMASVIAAAIAARSVEWGVLRAVGATGSIVIRLLIGESIMIVTTALLAGTMLGMHLAWMGTRLYRELAGLDLEILIPWNSIALSGAVLLSLALAITIPAACRISRVPTRVLLSGMRGE